MGFMLGVILGAALGIICMTIMRDFDYYYPEEEDRDDDE